MDVAWPELISHRLPQLAWERLTVAQLEGGYGFGPRGGDLDEAWYGDNVEKNIYLKIHCSAMTVAPTLAFHPRA